MPYRHAHWFVLALYPLAALAFWPNYLAQVGKAPMQMHLHGVTATLWLTLLVLQSWSIHSGQRAVHRKLGLLSLVLFPLFMAGGAGIFIGMAQRYVGQVTPFHATFAPSLGWLDVVAVAGFAWFFFQALRQRRNIPLHAGYLLATTVFLMPPITGRLTQLIPALTVTGPDEFWKMGLGFQLANALAAGIALAVGLLAVRGGRSGRPFFEAAGLTLVAALLFQFAGPAAWWTSLYAQAAAWPEIPFALAAGIAGAVIAWLGWTGGRRPAATAAAAA